MRRLVAALWAAGSLFFCGCEPTLELGAPCVRSSECAAPLACLASRCREECTADRDCTPGTECQPSGDVRACQLVDDVCGARTECPDELVCARARCRATCTSDADCTTDQSCALVDEIRVCVGDATVPDAGPTPQDAAHDAGHVDAGRVDAGMTRCPAGAIHVVGALDEFCLEASAGVDAAAQVRIEGRGAAARLLISSAGLSAGQWVRVFDEIDPDELRLTQFAFDLLSSPGGGQLIAAREIAGADGALLARDAACASGGGRCDCRDTDWRCEATTFDVWGREIVLGTRDLYSRSRVDPRDVMFDRRVIEVVADGVTTHEVALASIRQAPHDCPTARWRTDGAPALLRTPMEPLRDLGASLSARAGEQLGVFSSAECGIALDSSRGALDWSGETGLGTAPVTLELFFHPAVETGIEPVGSFTLVEHAGSAFRLMLRDAHLRAEAGSCAADAPALWVEDALAFPLGFNSWAHATVMVDWSAGRLCLARDGVLTGCVSAPACPMGAAPSGGVRIGQSVRDLSDRWPGGIDELRLRAGDHTPDRSRASASCYIDAACDVGPATRVRDAGSAECVPASSCATLAACPARAFDRSAPCSAAPAAGCMLSFPCLHSVANCAGECVDISACGNDIACP